jgi:RNA polymerase sigma-70 factor (ECF subfamily)
MVGATTLPGLALAFPALAQVQPKVKEQNPDALLARAAARGDRAAFARLVDLHRRSVHGLAFRLLRDPEEARDAAQETFVRAWGAVSTYDASQPFGPWILRIARNHALDLLRRRIPAARQVALDAEPEEGSPHLELAGDAVPADSALEQAQVRATLESAVAALPPNYREVVQLFHVEQLSYREIAETLDVPMGTVMTWLHRARGKLRATLLERGMEGSS